ncbi:MULTISPECIES: protein rep [unclassified Streptomyces]|uniref:protein rep n=1 Tax=unclassified Streptomyces TaxID=2593676 RepID=UPI0035DA5B0F
MQVGGGSSDHVRVENPVPAFTRTSRGLPLDPAELAARDAAFELREALRPVSGLARLDACGLSVLAGGVTPVLRNGRAGYAGVVTCGSVHVCPCCATSIRRVRQDELDQVGTFWECQSCGLVMMTLTMRHYERDALADLAELQREAWKRAFGQNAGRDWREAKKAFGVRGYVRAWEVTHGANGWHCHYHVLLFLARPLASGRVQELQHIAFVAWSTALEAVGARMPVEVSEKDGKPVAVRIDAPDRGEAGKLARYLMKGQDGKTKWGVAAELTRQDVKQGQGGHRTPFEIARAAVAGDETSLRLWQEFVVTATGIRSLYWSNGLRKLLADMGFELDDRADGKVAADEAAAGKPLACIPSATWYRHIARHKGRALALLHAAEKGGVKAIRALVESWGLTWDLDVLEAEAIPAGADPTADEILRRIERETVAARMTVWRDEFDRQDREARASRVVRHSAGAWEARAAAAKKVSEETDAAAARRAETGEADDNLLTRIHQGAAALPRRAARPACTPPKVRLKKPLKVRPMALAVVPPPPGVESDTCRVCGGGLDLVLRPYGQHVGDCLD